MTEEAKKREVAMTEVLKAEQLRAMVAARFGTLVPPVDDLAMSANVPVELRTPDRVPRRRGESIVDVGSPLGIMDMGPAPGSMQPTMQKQKLAKLESEVRVKSKKKPRTSGKRRTRDLEF